MSTTRFTRLLAASAVGVYLLVVVGATAALADAAAACGSWPLCAPGDGATLTPAFAVAVGHRAVAAVVGLLVLLTAVVGYRADTSRRVKASLLAAVALYPTQVVFGAFVAVSDAPAVLSAGHLLIAVGIFGSLLLALAWQLERETGDDDESPVADLEPDLPGEVPPAPTPSYDSLAERARATLWAYFQLTKPRLMWLLCLVAGAGMALASTVGPDLGVRTVLYTLGGGVLAIGASGTFNHVLERDVDRKMDRTSDRPLATHEVPVPNALVFGFSLAALSLVAFWQVNLLAAVLGLTAIVFYSVVYTLLLKPNTVQNTVIGGAAGALPALIGWVAVTGEVGVAGVALAAVVFLWTPAHFYNLALAYKDDYEKGGFPMMPVVRGETVTRKHILYYLGATLVGAAALAALTGLGWLYAGTTVAFGAVFLWAVVRLHREQTERAAFRAFHASNAYLGTLLVAIVVDSLVF
jgi:protoheme IX farnesyltransferase